jgi:protein-tyrosine phosphatase
MHDYSYICDGIYIGDVYSVIGNYRTREPDVLETLQIRAVISALTEDEYTSYMIGCEDFPGITWHRFVIDDVIDEPILEYAHAAHTILMAAENQPVFVHCAAGMSRSPSLVIAHLMLSRDWTYETALQFVKERRAIVAPNIGFVRQLLTLCKSKQTT